MSKKSDTPAGARSNSASQPNLKDAYPAAAGAVAAGAAGLTNPNVATGILSKEAAAWQQGRGAGPAPVRPTSPPVDPSRFSSSQNVAKGILSKEGAAWQQERMDRPGPRPAAAPATARPTVPPPAPPPTGAAAAPPVAPPAPTASPANAAAAKKGVLSRGASWVGNTVKAGLRGAGALSMPVFALERANSPAEYTQTGMQVKDGSPMHRAVQGFQKAGLMKLDDPSKPFQAIPDPSTPLDGIKNWGREGLREAGLVTKPSESKAPAPGANTPQKDKGYTQEDVDWLVNHGQKRHLTNAQIGEINPGGRITVTRQPNGVMSFSGGNVTGPASWYADENGKALPGTGLRNGSDWGVQGNIAVGNGVGYVKVNTDHVGRINAALEAGDISSLSKSDQQTARQIMAGGTFDEVGNVTSRETREVLERNRLRQDQEAQAEANRPKSLTIGKSGPDGKYDGYGAESYAWRRDREVRDATTRRPGESSGEFAVRSRGMLDMIKQRETNFAGTQQAEIQAGAKGAAAQRAPAGPSAAETKAAQEAQVVQISAQLWQQARNPMHFVELMAAHGMETRDAMALAEKHQAFEATNRDEALKSMMWAAQTDDKDQITEGSKARLTKMIEGLSPGFMNMTAQERLRAQPFVNAGVKIMNGVNQTQDTGWLPEWLGGDKPKAPFTSLPLEEFKKGGVLRDVGRMEGAWNRNVEHNDYAIELGNGQTLRLPRASVDDDVLRFMQQYGIDTSKAAR
jgi:hypothetical protein